MTPPPPPPSPSASQITRASSNVDHDTPADEATAAAAAAAEAALSPSTEDPQDECVLCAYLLPLKAGESVYQACCGETICKGCLVAQRRVLIIGTNVEKPIKGSKEEEREFMTMLTSEHIYVCPFCRADVPTDEKEVVTRLWERIDEYKDPKAMHHMGFYYMKGEYGLSKNLKKAEELLQRSYDLGDSQAARGLGILFTKHIPDEVRMIQYAEEGLRRGHIVCMNAVGAHAHQSGNYEKATRHFMMAARSGDDEAMQNLTKCYRQELVSKDDLYTTLRAHKAANDKRRSEPREYATRYSDCIEKPFNLAAGEITMGNCTFHMKSKTTGT